MVGVPYSFAQFRFFEDEFDAVDEEYRKYSIYSYYRKLAHKRLHDWSNLAYDSVLFASLVTNHDFIYLGTTSSGEHQFYETALLTE